MSLRQKNFRLLTVSIAAISSLLLTSCVSVDNSTHTPVATEVVIKATDAPTDMGTYMTGAFLTLTNDTGHEVTLVGAKSETAPIVEIHEVVNGMMQKKEGGVTIKNGESAVLAPGGNHIMLMGMTKPLMAGSEVSITLIFDDESELVVTGPVKVVNVEQEHYHSGSPSPMMSGM